MDFSLWPDADIKLVKSMYRDGATMQQIANEFPGRTRSAVCGLIDRLKLPKRKDKKAEASTRTKLQHRKERERSQPKPPSSIVVGPLGHEPFRYPNGDFVTLETVSDRTCRFPVGDPSSESFFFCGHKPKAGRPYCEACCKRAYQPINNSARVSEQDKAMVSDNARKSGLLRALGG